MAIVKIPGGITPDNVGMWGLFGLMNNVNNYSEFITQITTAGTNTTLTVAQLLFGVTKLNAGAAGGFTITLPSTLSILNGLGQTVPTDGTFAMPISIENNNVAQTGTLTIGDASTTLIGNLTIANNTRRLFLLTVLSPTTIAIENLGTIAL